MQPEVDELRPKLKEILYDCAVDIRATKAALYLFDGSKNFELATEYGFKGSGVRQFADYNDPVVDRCGRGRTPFFINGLAAEPRFSELMFESSTEFLLAAPLYARSQLVGFIDMRDKAAKQPFEPADIAKAQSIAERMVTLFANVNIFGHRFITLSDADAEAAVEKSSHPQGSHSVSAQPPIPPRAPAPPPVAAPKPPAPPPPQPQPSRPPAPPPAAAPPLAPLPPVAVAPPQNGHLPRMATLVIEARKAAGDIVIATQPESIGEGELATAREVLRSILLIPGAVAATLSAFGHMGGVQEIAARGPVTDEARNLLQSKLNVWLTKRGEAGGLLRTSVQIPQANSGPAVTGNDLQKVFTAPLTVGSLRGLYLTVAFADSPDRVAHELLATLHAYLQLVIEQSMNRGALSTLRAHAAERLIEPEFTKYPELRRHSDAVAKVTESFARFLVLPPAEAESARLLAMVHDCGMRLLDYDRLYRKSDLTQEELAFLREHPSVGAAMVAPLLGTEVARGVLSHHERFDGRGYPNELRGADIPLISRVVQLCDAWVAIADPGTYQTPESPESALTAISRGANSQFDGELAGRFVEMVRSGAR